MTGNPWEVRDAGDGLALELHGGDKPALVPRQGDQAIRVELTRVRALVASVADVAADLSEVLGGSHGKS